MDCKRVTWLSPIPQPQCPTPMCAACPQISTCGPSKTRPLTMGADFNIIPVAPLCQAPACLARANVAHPVGAVQSPPKALCVANPKRYYDDTVDRINNLAEYKYRWKNETCSGPDRLSGYKTLPFARPIPRYDGFKPRFPHPLPKAHPSPVTIELTSTMKEQYRNSMLEGRVNSDGKGQVPSPV